MRVIKRFRIAVIPLSAVLLSPSRFTTQIVCPFINVILYGTWIEHFIEIKQVDALHKIGGINRIGLLIKEEGINLLYYMLCFIQFFITIIIQLIILSCLILLLIVEIKEEGYNCYQFIILHIMLYLVYRQYYFSFLIICYNS